MKNLAYKCTCRIHFTENSFQDETLHVYYMLDNYYQNSRRYVKSVDPVQLIGRIPLSSSASKEENNAELASDCEPFRYKIETNVTYKYAPCGAIANSFFNDTFSMYYMRRTGDLKRPSEAIKLNISKKDLAWDSDRKFKFIGTNTTSRQNSNLIYTIGIWSQAAPKFSFLQNKNVLLRTKIGFIEKIWIL